MKNSNFKALGLASVAAIGALIATPASAAPVQGTGTATVKVLQAITVTKTADLDFGKVVAGSSASTATVGESDTAATCGGGAACYGTAAPGAFHVTGTDGEQIAITVDSSASLTGAGDPMTVDLSSTATSGNQTFASGAVDFKVAGVLHIGANQAAGTYTGNYNVTADYTN